MKIVQCKKCGKFYDAAKYKSCPVCAQGKAVQAEQDRKTEALFYNRSAPHLRTQHQSAGQQDRLTERYFDREKARQEERTIGVYRIKQTNPVAGWLVCTNGENRGRFYAIYTGRNTIGTSRRMDIVLVGKTICEDNHACVTYDDRHAEFYIQPQNGSLYVNGEPVPASCQLQTNDTIQLGDIALDFIAYCTKERNWNRPDKNEP